jgi:hypothetical protein
MRATAGLRCDGRFIAPDRDSPTSLRAVTGRLAAKCIARVYRNSGRLGESTFRPAWRRCGARYMAFPPISLECKRDTLWSHIVRILLSLACPLSVHESCHLSKSRRLFQGPFLTQRHDDSQRCKAGRLSPWKRNEEGNDEPRRPNSAKERYLTHVSRAYLTLITTLPFARPVSR